MYLIALQNNNNVSWGLDDNLSYVTVTQTEAEAIKFCDELSQKYEDRNLYIYRVNLAGGVDILNLYDYHPLLKYRNGGIITDQDVKYTKPEDDVTLSMSTDEYLESIYNR
jgi:hypothetical protein